MEATDQLLLISDLDPPHAKSSDHRRQGCGISVLVDDIIKPDVLGDFGLQTRSSLNHMGFGGIL